MMIWSHKGWRTGRKGKMIRRGGYNRLPSRLVCGEDHAPELTPGQSCPRRRVQRGLWAVGKNYHRGSVSDVLLPCVPLSVVDVFLHSVNLPFIITMNISCEDDWVYKYIFYFAQKRTKLCWKCLLIGISRQIQIQTHILKFINLLFFYLYRYDWIHMNVLYGSSSDHR